MDRAQIVHQNFLTRVGTGDFPAGRPPNGALADSDAVALFRNQCLSRALDLTSRAMQKAGQGFYTIGSSGHEGMAAVAAALRPTDMAFLHYRDAAFQLARADQVPGQSALWDMLLSFACSREDPISGGRHKVLGSRALMIPPQTSTIASHLPKALGAAYGIGLARRHPPEHRLLPEDALVVAGALLEGRRRVVGVRGGRGEHVGVPRVTAHKDYDGGHEQADDATTHGLLIPWKG